MSSTDYPTLMTNIRSSLRTLNTAQPEALKAFRALGAEAYKDGALDRKTKELMALGLGIAGHCSYCIGFHVEELIKLGITKAELGEAIAVAIQMGGGPSLMYGAEAMTAFEQLGGK
ncbi:MAG: carboxymuconolactone decarboxylase family protein [Alphaproteobacteria bacterium]